MLGYLAVKGTLDIVQDEAPTVTKNLLAQIPRRQKVSGAEVLVREGDTGGATGTRSGKLNLLYIFKADRLKAIHLFIWVQIYPEPRLD